MLIKASDTQAQVYLLAYLQLRRIVHTLESGINVEVHLLILEKKKKKLKNDRNAYIVKMN